MIATQYPTQDTVQDFWCLIHDQESPNIVILEPNEEVLHDFIIKNLFLKDHIITGTGG